MTGRHRNKSATAHNRTQQQRSKTMTATHRIATTAAVILMMMMTAWQAQAAAVDISGTYGTSDLALDTDYAFTTDGSTYWHHTWSGTDDYWSSDVSFGTGNTEVRIAGNVEFNATSDRTFNLQSTSAVRILNGGTLTHASAYGLRGGNSARMIFDTGSKLRFETNSGFVTPLYGSVYVYGSTIEVDLPNSTDSVALTANQFVDPTIDVINGNLALGGGTAYGATFDISAGSTVTLNDITLRKNDGTVSGTGVYSGTGTGQVVKVGQIAVEDEITLNSADGTTSATTGGFVWDDAGFGGASGSSLTNNGKFIFTAEGVDTTHSMALPFINNGLVLHNGIGDWRMSNGGMDLTVKDGAEFRFLKDEGRVALHNNADFIIESGGVLALDHTGASEVSDRKRDGTTMYGGSIDIKDGATLAVTNGGSIDFDFDASAIYFNGVAPTDTLGFNLINNGGTVDFIKNAIPFTTLAANTTLHMSGASAAVTNSTDGTNLLQGALDTINGTLQVSDGFSLTPGNGGTLTVSSTGTLCGNGTINGLVVTEGTVAPGNSPGELTLTSGLTSTGTIEIELAGLLAGDEFDILSITGGDAELDGVLSVELLDEFSPSFGTTFDVLTVTGGGSLIDNGLLLGGPDATLFSMDVNADSGVVTLTSIPEPTSVLLLALAGLAMMRRTRPWNKHS